VTLGAHAGRCGDALAERARSTGAPRGPAPQGGERAHGRVGLRTRAAALLAPDQQVAREEEAEHDARVQQRGHQRRLLPLLALCAGAQGARQGKHPVGLNPARRTLCGRATTTTGGLPLWSRTCDMLPPQSAPASSSHELLDVRAGHAPDQGLARDAVRVKRCSSKAPPCGAQAATTVEETSGFTCIPRAPQRRPPTASRARAP